jgi:hypothetical protein
LPPPAAPIDDAKKFACNKGLGTDKIADAERLIKRYLGLDNPFGVTLRQDQNQTPVPFIDVHPEFTLKQTPSGTMLFHLVVNVPIAGHNVNVTVPASVCVRGNSLEFVGDNSRPVAGLRTKDMGDETRFIVSRVSSTQIHVTDTLQPGSQNHIDSTYTARAAR